MAKLEVTGRLDKIGDLLTFPSKNGGDFSKREVIVNLMQYDRNTGEPIVDSNPVLFEFSGQNTDKLNGFNVGDMVTVAFSLKGFYYVSKTDNTQKQMNKIEGYDIAPYQSRRQQAQQPATAAAAQPAQGAPQAQPAPQPTPTPQDGGQPANEADQLPF